VKKPRRWSLLGPQDRICCEQEEGTAPLAKAYQAEQIPQLSRRKVGIHGKEGRNNLEKKRIHYTYEKNEKGGASGKENVKHSLAADELISSKAFLPPGNQEKNGMLWKSASRSAFMQRGELPLARKSQISSGRKKKNISAGEELKKRDSYLNWGIHLSRKNWLRLKMK